MTDSALKLNKKRQQALDPFSPAIDFLEDASEKVGGLLKDTAMMPVKGAGHVLWGLDKANKFVNKNVTLGGAAGILDPRKYGVDLPDKVDSVLDASYTDARNSLISIAKTHGPKLGFGGEKGWKLTAEIFTPDFIDLIGGIGYADNVAKGINKGGPGAGKLLKELGQKLDNALSPKMQLAAAGGMSIPVDKADEVIKLGNINRIKAIDPQATAVTLNPISRISGTVSSSLFIKPQKNIQGFVGDVYDVSKKDMPQIKKQLGEWLQQQLKEKGSVDKINRGDFGTIIIDGEPREISRITNYLTGDGELPLLPKIVTRKQAAFKRLQAVKPPKNELNKLGRQLGLTPKEIEEYYQDAVSGFKGVRDAAARNSRIKGQYHAGHFYPASRGGPTSRRSAGIELGKENVTKGNKIEASINIYAAQRAGIPTTWAEDMKMWFRDRQGLPGPRYESDFSNTQREIIESIPWDATEEQVEAIWKKHKLSEIPNIEQYKAVEKEFTSITTTGGLQIGGDRR